MIKKINVINISPKYSSFWKCGNYISEELKKSPKHKVTFIDLFKNDKLSKNKYIFILQMLLGVKFDSKKEDINIYISPLMSCSMKKNIAKNNIILIHDFDTIRSKNYFVRNLTKFIYCFIKKADLIISNSNTTKKEYVNYFGKKENIKTIYLGIDNDYFIKEKNISKKEIFDNKINFLSIGRDEPRKNLSFMIRLLNELNNKHIDFKLVRIGMFTKTNQKLIKNLNLNNKILIKTNVSEEELIKTYDNSDYLLFPSFYEGFGIPPIEAMSRDCIPLVSNKGSLPEIVKNKYILLPLKIKIWTSKIIELNKNRVKKQNILKNNKLIFSQYTWKNYAEKLKKVIEDELW